jgi:nucleotidyltransferase substrate binding protein (TIGR01987 family)
MSRTDRTKLEYVIENLGRSVESLREATAAPVAEPRDLAGIIKNFEFVYELSWVALKRALAVEGKQTSNPRSVFSAAFQEGWIENEDDWLKMIEDRNETVHTYDKKFAEAMAGRIIRIYLPLFVTTLKTVKEKCAKS